MKKSVISLLMIAAWLGAMAQSPSGTTPTATDSISTASANQPRDWKISLITCGPGQQIYQLEGHSGLRIQAVNPDSSKVDCVANWGVFDFDSPGFVYRFTKGETDYMLGITETQRFLRPYILEQREVTEQVLNLTESQAKKVAQFVNENFKPENRIYRYNYVRDNCATRPLAILERAIGDTIILSQPQAEMLANATFRGNMRQYHEGYPWYQFGIDLALGSDIDAPISPREMAFSPLALKEMISEAKIGAQPLVAQTITLAKANPEAVRLPATPWYLSPMCAAVAVAVIAFLLSVFDILRTKVSRWFDAILFLLFAIAGCVITFLVFFSVHEPASPNWLLLWLNPFCLIVPLFIWTKKTNRLVMFYQIANFAALIAMAVIWLCGVQQPNAAFIPLIIADAIRALTYITIYKCQPHSHRGKNQYRVNYYAR